MESLTPGLILTTIALYFLLLIGVSWWTARGETDNQTFFNARRSSPWYLVAIGMIGASLSGVTFISIPGLVGQEGSNTAFSYMQMVFGYLVGYFVIAAVLMPIYYKYNLTSIYGYLEKRLGFYSYKTGAAYFLLSRLIGSSFRLFLVAIVLDGFVLGPMGVPFWLTVAITILLIWIYTSKGGIKTIVVTDVFQTVAMLLAVVLTIVGISSAMGLSVGDVFLQAEASGYTEVFFFEGGWNDPNNFFKQFISGALIALVMTGLDQDMMQKNLTCRSLRDAQTNVFTFSIILVFANLLFLSLGAFLYLYAAHIGMEIPAKTDYLFPMLALEHLSPLVGIAFILGLVAAAYSSADSALTALTTSFCVDFLDMEKRADDESKNQKKRRYVHIVISFIIFLMIILFKEINNDAVINNLFKIAGYTYGPLLGLFAFSILTSYHIRDKYVIVVCLMAPVLTYVVDAYSKAWFNGLTLGYMNLALNGLLAFAGLMLIREKEA